jgi:hypothetical protein
MASSPSPPLDPNLPDNRGNYKLKAASRHLDNLRQIEATAGSLVSSNDRMHAEMEIDEFLYQLIGVKDALLQEINCELHLGFTLEEVRIETVNNELKQKRPNASDMTKEIFSMLSDPQDPLCQVNDFHNHSKHRAIIGKAIKAAAGRGVTKTSFINTRNREEMETPTLDYLADSYTRIEDLQKNVREKIRRYRNSTAT